MTDNVSYSILPESFHMPRYCVTCKHYDIDNLHQGFATCNKLVFATNQWRIVPREADVGKSPVSIVRTFQDFECRYWEGR